MKKYVDVIVPLPIASQYTYSLPAELEESVQEGCRVVVPFGRKKFYTAIVTKVHYAAPEGYDTKDIEEVLDSKPVLLPKQFEFWEWLSTYYLCTLGDVYKAALPSGMKLESETVVVYNDEFEATHPLGDSEQRLLDLLSAEKEQCVTQLQRSMGLKNILPVVKRLLEKEAIFVKEDIKRQYKPRTEARVRLVNPNLDEAEMMKLFDSMGRAKKQLAVLMKYVELSGWAGRGEHLKEVTKKELLEKAGATTTIFNGLVDKGVFEVYYQEIGRLQKSGITTSDSNALNPAQQEAFTSILDNF
ncbi:MAG: primosomal protein N', partial [Bacteroidaceae bacterium]|nr:primosomal protein N' [Bacteroidaceae bacterium]